MIQETKTGTKKKLLNLIKEQKLHIAIGIVIVVVVIVGAAAYLWFKIPASQATPSTTSKSTSTIVHLTSTIYVAPNSRSNLSQSPITGCTSCYGLFLYTVNNGDTLSSIASHYGLSSASIAQYNNITSVFAGEQILLPFYLDTIKTDVPQLPNQNAYDYYIISYAVTLHLNPMLIKAEVYDESNFYSSAISGHDAPPGVCGTGHSYGLLQYTPTCFDTVTSFGEGDAYVPNAKILLGQNNGMAAIECTSNCSKGDYFVSEFSNVSSSYITTDLVESKNYSGWNNSVFNPGENLFTVMQLESKGIDFMVLNGNGNCTYAQYNEIALAQYQQSNPYATNSCSVMDPDAQTYVNSVLYYYSSVAKYSVYGWTDEYSSSP